MNSDELREFNPLTNTWTEVVVGGQSPAGRHGHTASVLGSKMFIFGGRGNASTRENGQRSSLLGDAWEIDLDPSLAISIGTHASTVIPNGTPTFIPLKLTQSTLDEDMCVSDLAISVDIDHPCIGELHLTLYGPGPASRDTTYLEKTHMARAEPAVLFEGIPYSTSYKGAGATFPDGSLRRCCGNRIHASFNDSAENMLWESCEKGSPLKGAFRPVDDILIGRFLRAPAIGEWVLRVLDKTGNSSNGTVRGWSLDVEMRPCHWQTMLRWTNATPTDQRLLPSPRVHHTAVSFDGALFVSGGMGVSGALFDLWRRGNISSGTLGRGEWLLLSEGYKVPLASGGPFKPHGASVLVSPWGIISAGGITQGREGRKGELDAWVLDPVSKLWRPVSVKDGMRPPARYHSAAVMLRPAKASGGDQGWSVLLFGGKDDWHRFDDLWRLRLGNLQVSASVPTTGVKKSIDIEHEVRVWQSTTRPESAGSCSLAKARRDERCAHVLIPGTTRDLWQDTCGALALGDGKSNCTMGMVLDMAWCLGDYQGVGTG